jgi:hypothetical protein
VNNGCGAATNEPFAPTRRRVCERRAGCRDSPTVRRTRHPARLRCRWNAPVTVQETRAVPWVSSPVAEGTIVRRRGTDDNRICLQWRVSGPFLLHTPRVPRHRAGARAVLRDEPLRRRHGDTPVGSRHAAVAVAGPGVRSGSRRGRRYRLGRGRSDRGNRCRRARPRHRSGARPGRCAFPRLNAGFLALGDVSETNSIGVPLTAARGLALGKNARQKCKRSTSLGPWGAGSLGLMGSEMVRSSVRFCRLLSVPE